VLLIGVDEEAEPQVFVRPRNNYVTDLFKVLNEYYERVA
jgi:hypothetical protein